MCLFLFLGLGLFVSVVRLSDVVGLFGVMLICFCMNVGCWFLGGRMLIGMLSVVLWFLGLFGLVLLVILNVRELGLKYFVVEV